MLGIYENSIRKMSFETGIKKDDLEKALKEFEKFGKVKYIKNYVVLVNYMKHQNFNTNMKKSAIDCYNNLPNELKINDLTISKDNPLEGFERLLKAYGMVPKVEVEVLEDEVETKKEDIDFIYSLYPTKCVVNNSSSGKSKTNKEQIKRLLKTHSVTDLKTIIERYVIECRKEQVFMKNFKTFLNNLPDYETKESQSKYLPPIDKLVAHVALQVPTEKQKLLDKGYSIEEIKKYAK